MQSLKRGGKAFCLIYIYRKTYKFRKSCRIKIRGTENMAAEEKLERHSLHGIQLLKTLNVDEIIAFFTLPINCTKHSMNWLVNSYELHMKCIIVSTLPWTFTLKKALLVEVIVFQLWKTFTAFSVVRLQAETDVNSSTELPLACFIILGYYSLKTREN